MKTWTYLQLKTRIDNDLDMANETFVAPDEMVGYFNEAIDEAEAEIHVLGLEEDYFLTYASIGLVLGRYVYALPPDIYANKVRGFEYQSGSTIYPIKRIRRDGKFENIAETEYYSTSQENYHWFPQNISSAAGVQIVLEPASRETSIITCTISNASPAVVTKVAHGLSAGNTVAFSSTGLLPLALIQSKPYFVKTVLTADTFTVSNTPDGTVIATTDAGSGTFSYEASPFRAKLWYIRNAARIPLIAEGTQAITEATLVDIPEFANFLLQYVKCRIWEKEGNPNLQTGLAVLEQQRKMMVDTLTQMVPDDDDQIQPDLSHYEELS